MENSIASSPVILLCVTIGAYVVSKALYTKIQKSFFNPLLVSILVVILYILFFDIPQAEYKEATSIIDFFLNLSVVSLGYLLYKQYAEIRKNIITIVTSLTIASIVAIVSVVFIARELGATFEIERSLEAKSITTPIAVSISQNTGGISSLTALAVIIAGIAGSILAPLLFKLFRINSSIAKGLALGAASHALGTSKAIEIGAIEGAMSSLAIGVMAIITIILIPILQRLIY